MEIKRYKKGDEREILKLFSIAFGKDLSMDFWKWRYLQNPFLEDPVINLMWDGTKLIGHYAVSPVVLNVKGESIMTSLSLTTMTHPEYGGKGIFTKLAEDLYQNMYSIENIEAVWGFPN